MLQCLQGISATGARGPLEKQENLWWEEKGVGAESSAKGQFLYDPGQINLIATLNFEQGI